MKTSLVRTVLAMSIAGLPMALLADTPAQWQRLAPQLAITLEQAIQAATHVVPGKVIEIEVDDGDGSGPRYEAQVITPEGENIEVWIDGASGMARQHEHDGKAKNKDLRRLQEAKITLQQAIDAALRHSPGRVVKAELDSHWGKASYQVEVLQADFSVMELKLDAQDGAVLRAKRD